MAGRADTRGKSKGSRRRPWAAWLASLAIVPVAGAGASVALGAIDAAERAGGGSGSHSGDAAAGRFIAVSKPAAQAESLAERRKLRRVKAAARTSDELSWPLRGAITGQFGEGRGGHSHAGIDIPMPAGTPIKAASAGRVMSAAPEDGYGNYICIAHVELSTCYAHLESFRAKAGQRVRRGEVIGYVGNTGNSGTIHLHFEVRRGTAAWGEPADPLKYLPG
jgi:murein DD-endopeptidase MepM/ murein hydrolase activator NlpD